jgi:hypothetical protein
MYRVMAVRHEEMMKAERSGKRVQVSRKKPRHVRILRFLSGGRAGTEPDTRYPAERVHSGAPDADAAGFPPARVSFRLVRPPFS